MRPHARGNWQPGSRSDSVLSGRVGQNIARENMGIIKRIEHREKRIVERRSDDLIQQYIAWRARPKQSEAPGWLNSGANLRSVDAATPSGQVMLREHPLMNYRTLSNWPPVWTPRGRKNGATVETVPDRHTRRGEFGTLQAAFISTVSRPPRIYLMAKHEGREYVGSLLFTDAGICRQFYEFFKEQAGKRISEIGMLDVSQLI